MRKQQPLPLCTSSRSALSSSRNRARPTVDGAGALAGAVERIEVFDRSLVGVGWKWDGSTLKQIEEGVLVEGDELLTVVSFGDVDPVAPEDATSRFRIFSSLYLVPLTFPFSVVDDRIDQRPLGDRDRNAIVLIAACSGAQTVEQASFGGLEAL